MTKFELLLISSLCWFSNCVNTDVEKNVNPVQSVSEEIDNRSENEELESPSENEKVVNLNDSLALEFAKMNDELSLTSIKFEKQFNQFYTLGKNYSSIYEIGSTNWYFDSDFNLVHCVNEFAVEGGYEEYEKFYYSNAGQVIWHFKSQEFEDTKEIIQVSKTKLKPERIVGKLTKEQEVSFFIPEKNAHSFDFNELVLKTNSTQFVYDTQFIYEDYNEVESPYGGTEMEGYTIRIDTTLFNYFYPKKN